MRAWEARQPVDEDRRPRWKELRMKWSEKGSRAGEVEEERATVGVAGAAAGWRAQSRPSSERNVRGGA